MACGNEFVSWVGGLVVLDCAEYVVPRIDPGLPEAVVCGAAGAEIGGGELEVEVCEPIFNGGGAAEGDDEEVVCVVGGDEASYVCGGYAGGRG